MLHRVAFLLALGTLAALAGSGCGQAASVSLPNDTPGLIRRLGQAQQLARGTLDPLLVGTWSGTTSRLTTNAVSLQGQVRLRVWPKGQYLAISKDAEQFVVETGWLDAREGAWRRRLLLGGEILAAYSLSDQTLSTAEIPGQPPTVLHRSASDALLTRAEALLQVAATPTASDWARRGLDWARLWESDAQLFAVQITDPTPQGYIGKQTQLFLDYHSERAHARLSLTPGLLGTVTAGVFAGDIGLGGARDPIPLPIPDLSEIVAAAGPAKEKSIYLNAILTADRTADSGTRLAWFMTPANGRVFEHVCWDVPKAQFFDCTKVYGDQAADYERLAARAAAAMRRLMQSGRPAGGAAPTWSLSGGAVDNSPGAPAWDGGAAYRQSSAESSAYWSGDSDAYNRVLNHECNSSDSANYGC